MKKISSNATFIFKVVFPMIWGIILIGSIIISFIDLQKPHNFTIPTFFLNIAFLPVSLWFIWYFGWRFVDDVYDLGDGLLVKNKNQQILIKDADIEKVTFSTLSYPSPVTVYLKSPSELGKKFYFASKRNSGFFMMKNPDIEQIKQRIQTTSQP